MKFNTPFRPPRVKGIKCSEKSLVNASELPLSDINQIMARYPVTHQLPRTARTAAYLDLAGPNSSLIRSAESRMELFDSWYDRLSEDQQAAMPRELFRKGLIEGSLSLESLAGALAPSEPSKPVEAPSRGAEAVSDSNGETKDEQTT